MSVVEDLSRQSERVYWLPPGTSSQALTALSFDAELSVEGRTDTVMSRTESSRCSTTSATPARSSTSACRAVAPSTRHRCSPGPNRMSAGPPSDQLHDLIRAFVAGDGAFA